MWVDFNYNGNISVVNEMFLEENNQNSIAIIDDIVPDRVALEY